MVNMAGAEHPSALPPIPHQLPSEPRRRPRRVRGAEQRRALLAEHFAHYGDVRAAAEHAGYTVRSARVILQQPRVRTAVATIHARIRQKTQMDAEEWRARVAAMCRTDVRALMDPETGKLRPVAELGDEAAAIVAGLDVSRSSTRLQGKGEDAVSIEEQVLKIKLVDRPKMYELLGRSLGLQQAGQPGGAGAPLTPAEVARLDDAEVEALARLVEKARGVP
jgi:hypothetical protein